MNDVRLLLSYYWARSMQLGEYFAKNWPGPLPRIFGDSGAFSAKVKGETLRVEDYARWVLANRAYLTDYANLDVIGDERATSANQTVLESFGLAPIPVFHIGSPLVALEALIERYPYIALGGLVGLSTHAKMPQYLTRVFALARGRSVFHGFGMTTWRHLTRFPFYSVDSSNWLCGKYMNTTAFDERTHRWRPIELGRPEDVQANAALLRTYDVPLTVLATRNAQTRYAGTALSVRSHLRAERYLRRLHGPVVCAGREDGLMLYLVANPGARTTGGSPANIAYALSDKYKEDLCNLTT